MTGYLSTLSQADITSGSLEQVAVGADVDLSQLQVVQASALSAEQIDMDAFQAEISAKGLEGKTVVALQEPAQADIVQLAEVIADDKAATPGLKLGAL